MKAFVATDPKRIEAGIMGSDRCMRMNTPIGCWTDLCGEPKGLVKGVRQTDLGLCCVTSAHEAGDAPPGAVYRFLRRDWKEEHVLGPPG